MLQGHFAIGDPSPNENDENGMNHVRGTKSHSLKLKDEDCLNLRKTVVIEKLSEEACRKFAKFKERIGDQITSISHHQVKRALN